MLISTRQEHEAALAELTALIDQFPTDVDVVIPPEVLGRFDVLADAIEAYEAIHYPMKD